MKVEAILLNMHYKYAIFLALDDLKAIVNGDPSTSKFINGQCTFDYQQLIVLSEIV
jgi:hypothetical protein